MTETASLITELETFGYRVRRWGAVGTLPAQIEVTDMATGATIYKPEGCSLYTFIDTIRAKSALMIN